MGLLPLPGARRSLVLRPAHRRPARGVLPRLSVPPLDLARVGFPHVSAASIVSAVAGAVAVLALRRLGDLEVGPGAGNRAVLLLVLAPPAVFLAAPYTESLFLAFAIPAWLAARRGQWAMAGVLRRRLHRTGDRPVPRGRAGRGVPDVTQTGPSDRPTPPKAARHSTRRHTPTPSRRPDGSSSINPPSCTPSYRRPSTPGRCCPSPVDQATTAPQPTRSTT